MVRQTELRRARKQCGLRVPRHVGLVVPTLLLDACVAFVNEWRAARVARVKAAPWAHGITVRTSCCHTVVAILLRCDVVLAARRTHVRQRGIRATHVAQLTGRVARRCIWRRRTTNSTHTSMVANPVWSAEVGGESAIRES